MLYTIRLCFVLFLLLLLIEKLFSPEDIYWRSISLFIIKKSSFDAQRRFFSFLTFVYLICPYVILLLLYSHVDFNIQLNWYFPFEIGGWLEADSDKLLPRRMAGNGQYSWHCWCHVYNIHKQKEHGLSIANQLQSTRS